MKTPMLSCHLAVAAATRSQRRRDRRFVRELGWLRRRLAARRVRLGLRLLGVRLRLAAAILRRELEAFFRPPR